VVDEVCAFDLFNRTGPEVVWGDEYVIVRWRWLFVGCASAVGVAVDTRNDPIVVEFIPVELGPDEWCYPDFEDIVDAWITIPSPPQGVTIIVRRSPDLADYPVVESVSDAEFCNGCSPLPATVEFTGELPTCGAGVTCSSGTCEPAGAVDDWCWSDECRQLCTSPLCC
jgi:hypothetical protein